jgi:uncharacterized protein
MFDDTTSLDAQIEQRFRDFIANPEFPCVGAKSAMGKGRLTVHVARSIRSAWDDIPILAALNRIANGYREDPQLFTSLAIVFRSRDVDDEAGFEAALWDRVQSLSDKDAWLGLPADPRVSDDPDDPHFSLSFGGEAFFVVGLHPAASRPARRFERPALVFNLHDQFEQLREQGRYEKLRASIIARDVELAGGPNPMLARHGTVSEARQYSGRPVGEAWECPFKPADRLADA